MSFCDLPIGVFDSGLGGLSAVREIMTLMPDESVVYFGDTSRVPYGTRSADTIIKYALQDAGFLASFNIKAMLIACGTVSSLALGAVCEKYSFPVVGVVGPAARAAAAKTKNGRIAVLGTSATVNSGSFGRELEKIGRFEVYQRACPLFVPLVENGFHDGEMARLAAKEYLSDIAGLGPDTIILGCTHYPLMAQVIGERFPGASLINTGYESALALREILEKNGLRASGNAPSAVTLYASDPTQNFRALANRFLADKADAAAFADDKVDIDDY